MERPYKNLALIYTQTRNNVEFAEKANLSVSTIKRIKKEPGFIKAVEEIREKAFKRGLAKSQLYFESAVETLHELSQNENIGDTARVSSCKAIIEASVTAYEISDIEPLLKQLREGESDNEKKDYIRKNA